MATKSGEVSIECPVDSAGTRADNVESTQMDTKNQHSPSAHSRWQRYRNHHLLLLCYALIFLNSGVLSAGYPISLYEVLLLMTFVLFRWSRDSTVSAVL